VLLGHTSDSNGNRAKIYGRPAPCTEPSPEVSADSPA
jgi:hypothetical protein